ncbi:MAG: response regulator [Sandaracinus sp.]
MRALVVDDELATRTLVAGVVRGLGLEVSVAVDGADAWAQHLADPFPIVVTDWMMPNVDGIELVRRIRGEKPRTGYTYILVVTTLSKREHTYRAFETGADDMVCKPVDAAQIGARITVAKQFLAAHETGAEEAYLHSLELLQGEIGADHLSVTPSLAALAKLYRGRGAVARARAFMRREIDVITSVHGPDDPRVAALREELRALSSVPAFATRD